jgi:hypothetical protein
MIDAKKLLYNTAGKLPGMENGSASTGITALSEPLKSSSLCL